jgi:hypothetical protein
VWTVMAAGILLGIWPVAGQASLAFDDHIQRNGCSSGPPTGSSAESILGGAA